ncbi:hypothetical protein ABZX92_05510 [Lentzea sp. NPDC006480]|uniref:hypothetical protein n=1 Tax=Lentzea sp. NPDC006480 TaxID=3157176 RepID=UPI0033AF09C6
MWITGLRAHWWRFALGAAGLAVSFADASLYLALPILLWCALARTVRTGLVVGLVLLALQAWFVVPRGLGWSGPWVPAAMEGFWLYPLLTGVVCSVSLLVDGRWLVGVVWLAAVVGLGLLGTAVAVLDEHEGAAPGDEGVLPGPSGLRLSHAEMWCGSGHGANCARQVEATGERAHEVMRTHLASHGYTSAKSLSNNEERVCRSTGLVFGREVCAELKDLSATAVKVTWYVNRR